MTSGEDPPRTSHVLELDDGVPDISEVRQWTRTALSRLHEDDALDVLLIVTELVSNVYDHGRFPARLCLHERTEPRAVRIEVEDASSKPPVLQPTSAGAQRGRGLIIVDQLAQGWGVAQHTVGKTVWALISCVSTPAYEARL
ncbi:ATP-binding protein [Lentzea cavernae]|uniref:ATP-binding protein n=1 Tax=Lentzea cavernae TaxID=2020703 RepID=UPI00174C728D|nr:ATP-binding protein [Lentzea cavernae]